jgi:hypothetical protein
MTLVTRAHREWLDGKRPEIADETRLWECVGYVVDHERRGEECGRDYCMPIELQVKSLQLSKERIRDLIRMGGKVLDVGCGKQASLVCWLRELGIDAEGIDPNVETDEPFLIKQTVNGSAQQTIPRPDNYYVLIIAHQNTSLNPLSEGRLFGNPTIEKITTAANTVFEILRVLNDRGNFRCWEGLSRLDFFGPQLTAADYEHNRVKIHEGLAPEEVTHMGDSNYLSVVRKVKSF